jgi:O-antigen/teichoic acid export membrane protein
LKSKLLSNLSKVFSGIAAYALFQILISSLISKFYGTQQLAEYLFIFALSATVFFLTNLGLRQVLVTSSKYSNFSDYYKIRLTSSMIACVIIFVGFSMSQFNNYYLLSSLCAIKFFESLSEINYAIKQKFEEHQFQSVSLLFKSILSILFFSAAYILDFGITAAFYVILLIHLFVFYLLEIKKLSLSFSMLSPYSIYNFKINWDLIKYALPLGVGLFLINLNLNFPRIFSGIYLNEYDTAGIGASIQIALAGVPIITGITQTLLPRFSKLITENKVSMIYSLYVKTLLLLGVLCILGIMLSYFHGEQILHLIFNEEVSKYSYIFVLICTAISLNYLSAISTLIIISCEEHKINLYIMTFSFFMGITYLFFVKNIDVTEIAFSLLVSTLGRFLLTLSISVRLLRKKKSLP